MTTRMVQNRLLQTTALVAFIGIQAVGMSAAYADDFVITTAVTTVNGGSILNGTDSLTITSSGSIVTTTVGSNEDAISATGVDNTITNNGTVDATAGTSTSDGISTTGANNTITNSGTITVDDTQSYAIKATGGGATIVNSGTVTTDGHVGIGIDAQGGNNTVTNSGTIITNNVVGSFSFGIQIAAADNIVDNSGSISTQGAYGVGISGQGSTNGTVTNSGTITTSGDDADGIQVGTGSTVTNTGTIITTGDYTGSSGSVGISGGSTSTNVTITNNGTISTTGESGYGIQVIDSSRVTNSNLITTTGAYGAGIVARHNSVLISNTGTIRTTGDDAGGIEAYDNNIITNSGSIFVSGASVANSASGIYVQTGNTITNTGSVISSQNQAFYFTGTGNTLNLNAPSFIGGDLLTLGGTTTLNIKTGPSHSIAWAFDSTDLVGGAPTISGSVPVFQGTVGGNLVVATFDPTSLAGGTDGLAGMVGLVSGVTQGRLSNGSAGSNALGYAANSTSIIDETFAEVEAVNQGWVQVVGSFANYDGGSSTLDSEQSQAALVAGYDWSLSDDTVLGVMAGYTQGEVKSDSNFVTAVDNDSKGFFAGVFGRTNFDNAFLSFGLSAGVSNHDDDRFVNDNMAPLGVAHALGDYSSTWINPEIAYGMYYDLSGGWVAAPTVRLSYAGQWMDGYTETGTSANATVGDRQIGVAELALEWSATQKTETSTLTARLGYAYRASVGDSTTDITLVGVTKAIANNSKDRHVAYLGGDALFALGDAMDIELGAQVEFSEDHHSAGPLLAGDVAHRHLARHRDWR